MTGMDWSSSRGDMQRLELELELGWSLGQAPDMEEGKDQLQVDDRADAIRSCGMGWLCGLCGQLEAVSRDMPMFTTDAAVVDELQKGQPAVEGH